MKKILLSSAAILGVSFAAAPAMAQVDVTVGGHTKNYVGWADQEENVAGADVKSVDMLRESELHFNAEGTADNGLTYGFHIEAEVDGGNQGTVADSFAVEESYLYLSSNLGRLNLGSEDGANYLLQVAAPSADANIDGLRQYINPVNYGAGVIGAAAFAELDDVLSNGVAVNNRGLDYANDATATAEKITYLSPNWSGFQFGLSYTPDVLDTSTNVTGFNLTDVGLEDAYEGSLRYEGTFNNVGFAVGGGYTHVENDTVGVGNDDITQWNVGTDLDIGAFGLGAVYTETNSIAGADDVDAETIVLGADYTTGPFQFGLSYLNKDLDRPAGGADTETDRYTGGVVYTVTQGLTLRGSISFVDHETGGAGVPDVDATSGLVGVQFNF